MFGPQEIPHTIAYLKTLNVLSDLVDEQYGKICKSLREDAERRGSRLKIIKETIAQLKEDKKIYIIIHFPATTSKCPHKDCYVPIGGVYYEISNPVTNKNLMIPSEMWHNMVFHGIPGFVEQLANMGNSPMGTTEQYLKCKDFITVMKDSNAPPEIIEEITAIKPMIDELEAQRYGGMVQETELDLSAFEPTEHEKENNIIPFFALLREMVNWGAEDIHIKAGCRPLGVVKGMVQPAPMFPDFLTPERTKYYAWTLMNTQQQQQFEETLEMDNSFQVPGVARFRCNIYWAQGTVGLVFRVIPTKIRPAEVLGVPAILKKLVFERMGLVLVTGQTGSGKTTTLAAILEFGNMNRSIHILTLENPVEYVYENKGSVFTQRAIEIDSLSFPMAMRGALRQKPDIILIGEMRDPDTIIAGLKAAETGHLVLSTLHTNDAVQTINRLINAFPPHEQATIRLQLASSIKACVAQRLIPRLDKPGRVCAIEILLVTPNARGQNTREYISRNESSELYKVVATSGYDGMQSMNMALFEHYTNCVISGDDALAFSDNPEELIRWMRQGPTAGRSTDSYDPTKKNIT